MLIKSAKTKSYILGFTILILTIVYIFSPFKSSKYIYEWNPSVDGIKVRLSLLELNPKEFEITFPCIATSINKQTIFEALGGPAFLFEADANYYYLSTGDSQSNTINVNKLPRPKITEKCESILTFNDKLNTIKISSSNSIMNVNLLKGTNFYFSSYLKWNEELKSEGFLLKVSTKTLVGAEKTLLKRINLIFIVLLLLFRFHVPMTKYISNITRIKVLEDKFDYLSIIFIGISIFTVAPMSDDGLYLVEARILDLVGNLIQFQYPVTFPTGHIHAWLNGVSYNFSLGIFYTRLIPGIILFSIWKLISKIEYNFGNIKSNSKSFLFTLWVLYVFSYGMTLRPEPYIALIFFGLIYLLKKAPVGDLRNPLAYSIFGTSLALSIHQSGFILIFASIPIWIFALRNWDSFKRNIEIIYVSIVIAILIFFLNSSLFLFFKRFQNFERVNNWPQPFTGEFRWGYPPYQEYMRLIHLKLATPSQILLVSLILIMLITLFISFNYIRNFFLLHNPNIHIIYFSILCAPLGLILAPSKWADHYAALLPVLIIGHLILRFFKNIFELAQLTTIVLALISLLLPWKNGGSETLNFNTTFRSNYFLEMLNLRSVIFYLFLIILVVIIVLRNFTSSIKSGYLDFITMFLIIITPISQIGPNIIDSLIPDKGWTFSRQIIGEIKNSGNECGIYDKNTLRKLGINYDVDTFVFNQESLFYYSCLNQILPRGGIWTFPNFSVGGIPIWDQQRLANEARIERIYCPNFTTRSFDDEVDRCIYKWSSLIPDMRLVGIEQVSVY
jgi:hypothetical protein